MLRSHRIAVTCFFIHLFTFLGIGVAVWQVREPDAPLPDVIVWSCAFGLLLFELFPGGYLFQLLAYAAAWIVFIIVSVKFARTQDENHYLVRWNVLLAVLYLFPYFVGSVGRYHGP